jgi:predicted DNA-binding WGR domain protein
MGGEIDVDIRGEDHITEGKTWKRACRHIGLLLWWAAERGLAGGDHDAKKARKAPTRYFIEQCDTKLFGDDLSDEGGRFVVDTYDAYLAEVGAYAAKRKIGLYDIPENAATAKHFFEWLDRELAVWRSRAKHRPKPKKKPKPKKFKSESKRQGKRGARAIHLEYRKGDSQKYWAIEVKGSTHSVHFGRIGTSGQTKTKPFDSPETAQRDADKLIAGKRKKGYS